MLMLMRYIIETTPLLSILIFVSSPFQRKQNCTKDYLQFIFRQHFAAFSEDLLMPNSLGILKDAPLLRFLVFIVHYSSWEGHLMDCLTWHLPSTRSCASRHKSHLFHSDPLLIILMYSIPVCFEHLLAGSQVSNHVEWKKSAYRKFSASV